MTVYAYLRVSTEEQDLTNQKFGVEKYAEQKGFSEVTYYEDKVSGFKKPWQERGLGKIVLNAKAGDIILIPEISRIGRTVLQVLQFLETTTRSNVSVHIVKSNMVMDGSISSRLLAMVLGFAAEIERDLISVRTTEALAKRKASGLPMGRPKGSYGKSLKLKAHEADIKRWLKVGMPKKMMAQLLECSLGTLYAFLEANELGEYITTRTKNEPKELTTTTTTETTTS